MRPMPRTGRQVARYNDGPLISRFNEDKADTDANVEILEKETGVIIAVCYDDEGREEHTARLFASAPVLLEALLECKAVVASGILAQQREDGRSTRQAAKAYDSLMATINTVLQRIEQGG